MGGGHVRGDELGAMKGWGRVSELFQIFLDGISCVSYPMLEELARRMTMMKNIMIASNC